MKLPTIIAVVLTGGDRTAARFHDAISHGGVIEYEARKLVTVCRAIPAAMLTILDDGGIPYDSKPVDLGLLVIGWASSARCPAQQYFFRTTVWRRI